MWREISLNIKKSWRKDHPSDHTTTCQSVLYIQDDPLLCDLATTCTLEEVRGRVALEHGQAINVNVVKDTAEIMGEWLPPFFTP